MKFTCVLIAVLISSPGALALPQLTCRGNLAVWVIREGRPLRLNPLDEDVTVDPRRDAAFYLGLRADRPWLKVILSQPLAWINQRDHYQSVTTLKIKTDMVSYFNVRAEGLLEPVTQVLLCDLDDHARLAKTNR